jgi:quinol monooxygenase YgiN
MPSLSPSSRRSKPGKESQVRQELLSMVAPSRKDAGCLNCDLHQALDNPALFFFHENWTSQDHWSTICKSRM